MKRFLMCVAILGLAAPVLAEPTSTGITPIPAGAPRTYVNYDVLTQEITYSSEPRDAGGAAKFEQYNDTGSSGYFFGAGTMVGDELHEFASTAMDPNSLLPRPSDGIWPSTITEITFGAYIYTAAGIPGWSANVVLIDNPGGTDSAGLMGSVLTFITGIGPLPLGEAIVTISGLKIVKPAPDMWFLVDYSGGIPADPNMAPAGPLLTGQGGAEDPVAKPAVGYSHNYFWMAGSLYWFGGNPWADFYHKIRGVPEPVTIGFLAIGGLLALRRRRS